MNSKVGILAVPCMLSHMSCLADVWDAAREANKTALPSVQAEARTDVAKPGLILILIFESADKLYFVQWLRQR